MATTLHKLAAECCTSRQRRRSQAARRLVLAVVGPHLLESSSCGGPAHFRARVRCRVGAAPLEGGDGGDGLRLAHRGALPARRRLSAGWAAAEACLRGGGAPAQQPRCVPGPERRLSRASPARPPALTSPLAPRSFRPSARAPSARASLPRLLLRVAQRVPVSGERRPPHAASPRRQPPCLC